MRFDKLEFDQPSRAPISEQLVLRVQQDETHWAKLADDNRRTGCYEAALRFYSRALEFDKALIAAWVGQVQMLVQLGEYPQAGLWSQKALELFPSNGDLMAGQAQAACRLGNLSKAHALSDNSLQQRGESAYRWQVRGELMVSASQRTDRHCFDKAQLADDDWLVPLETAVIYGYYHAFGLAQQRARMAVEKAPDSYYAWYLLGVFQAKQNLDVLARASFQRCLELCPGHIEARVQLSTLERPRWSALGLVRRLIGR